MRVCPNCGNPLGGSPRYCAGCATQVGPEHETTSGPLAQASPASRSRACSRSRPGPAMTRLAPWFRAIRAGPPAIRPGNRRIAVARPANRARRASTAPPWMSSTPPWAVQRRRPGHPAGPPWAASSDRHSSGRGRDRRATAAASPPGTRGSRAPLALAASVPGPRDDDHRHGDHRGPAGHRGRSGLAGRPDAVPAARHEHQPGHARRPGGPAGPLTGRSHPGPRGPPRRPAPPPRARPPPTAPCGSPRRRPSSRTCTGS